MLKAFKKLWNDERGNALIMIGAALPIIVGAAGLATDTIQWTLWKRQLQRAADSAAIAGTYDRVNASGSTATVPATVSHDLSLNLHTSMAVKGGYPLLNYPANSGVITNQVQVTLAVQQQLPFSSLFLSSAPTIIARSTAASVPSGGDPCFFATETGTTWGLYFSGDADVEAPDCDGFSNSSGTDVSIAKGSSDVTLNTVGGVGGVQQSNNFHVDAYRPYSPPLTDPFKDVTPDPSDMKCAGTMETVKGKGQDPDTEVFVEGLALTEDTVLANAKDASGNQANCFSSLSVGSNKTLTLPAGTYYINAGDVFVQGDLTCNGGCTIVLTNKTSSSPIGQFKVNADSKVNIEAPTTGTYKGIAIYQDRRATDASPGNKINGNSDSVIKGALYFPSQELDYNGTGTTTAVCTMFVGRRLKFSGNSSVSNKFKKLADCGAYGIPSGNTMLMVRLVA